MLAQLAIRIKSRMKLAGHMVRMKDERSQKRCETKKPEGCRKRGRQQLRWEEEERSETGRGRRKVANNGKSNESIRTVTNERPHPGYKRETGGRTRDC